MTAVSVTDSTLTTQCLDFCQALAGQGKVFKFSITIDSTFTFSLDTREGKETFPTRIKKRSSPSTIRRNAKRREEYLKRSPSEAATATGLETIQKQCNAFQCDHCDSTFKTENGLKIHKGRSHKEASSPEKIRKPSSQSSLIVSPIREQSRVEPCHNCGMDMAPTHQCQNDQDSTQHIIKIYYYYHTSCICLTLLHCVFSNESSNRLFGKMPSHTGCICLTYLHFVFSNESSNRLPVKMQNHIGCICLTFLHCCDFK